MSYAWLCQISRQSDHKHAHSGPKTTQNDDYDVIKSWGHCMAEFFSHKSMRLSRMHVINFTRMWHFRRRQKMPFLVLIPLCAHFLRKPQNFLGYHNLWYKNARSNIFLYFCEGLRIQWSKWRFNLKVSSIDNRCIEPTYDHIFMFSRGIYSSGLPV